MYERMVFHILVYDTATVSIASGPDRFFLAVNPVSGTSDLESVCFKNKKPMRSESREGNSHV